MKHHLIFIIFCIIVCMVFTTLNSGDVLPCWGEQQENFRIPNSSHELQAPCISNWNDENTQSVMPLNTQHLTCQNTRGGNLL